MTDLLPIWIKNLTSIEQRLVAVLLGIAVLLLLLHLIRTPLRDWQERRQIARTVKRLGARILRDISLQDGMGGEVRIDYLALRKDAILVIGVKRYDGMIFGSTKTDEWTQTINSRSYKFPNPDTYLARQISAIRNIIPKTPVRGLHLFTDSAVFPWDKPPNVRQLKDLHNSGSRRPTMKDIPAELRTAWSHIVQAISQ
jgi:restriction system protein